MTELSKRVQIAIQQALELLLEHNVVIDNQTYGPVPSWATCYYVTLSQIDPKFDTAYFTVILADDKKTVYVFHGHVKQNEILSRDMAYNKREPLISINVIKWEQREIRLTK